MPKSTQKFLLVRSAIKGNLVGYGIEPAQKRKSIENNMNLRIVGEIGFSKESAGLLENFLVQRMIDEVGMAVEKYCQDLTGMLLDEI